MDNIDIIFYINLEHRKDRNEHFLNEINKLCTDPNKIIRIDAVYNKLGTLGCTLSHIKALHQFESNPNWNTCMILEDDFTFRCDDIQKNNEILNNVFKNFPDFDVISLSYNPGAFLYEDTNSESIKKVIETQTTSGYIVNRKFVSILKNNFLTSAASLIKDGWIPSFNCLDIYWKKLQPVSNWYATFPAIGYQYANYSEIENKYVNYDC